MKNHVLLLSVTALALGLLCAGCHSADSQSGSTPPPAGSVSSPPGAAPASSPAAAAAQVNGAGLGARNHPASGTP